MAVSVNKSFPVLVSLRYGAVMYPDPTLQTINATVVEYEPIHDEYGGFKVTAIKQLGTVFKCAASDDGRWTISGAGYSIRDEETGRLYPGYEFRREQDSNGYYVRIPRYDADGSKVDNYYVLSADSTDFYRFSSNQDFYLTPIIIKTSAEGRDYYGIDWLQSTDANFTVGSSARIRTPLIGGPEKDLLPLLGLAEAGIPKLEVYTDNAVTDTTATVSFSCVNLLETDPVYRIKAWVYKPADGLDTTLPATYTGNLFSGPVHAETVTITGLTPGTVYWIYSVIWLETEQAASEQNSTIAFTTTQTDPELVLEARQVRTSSFDLRITRRGLEGTTKYVAEVIVYHADTTMVAFEEELTFVGNGTAVCSVTGLEPETIYGVSVDVYPYPTGANVVRADYTVATAAWDDWHIYAGVSGTARQVKAIYLGVKGTARKVSGVYRGVGGKAQPL